MSSSMALRARVAVETTPAPGGTSTKVGKSSWAAQQFRDFDNMASNFAVGAGSVSPNLEFPLEWCAILWLMLLSVCASIITRVIFPMTAWDYCGYLLVYILTRYAYRQLATNTRIISPHYAPLFSVFVFGWEFSILCLSFLNVITMLSYLCCAWDAPLIDHALSMLDAAIGINRAAMFHLLLADPLGTILHNAYESFGPQLTFIVCWFACLRDKKKLQETFWLFLLCAVVTIVLFGCFPAFGPAETRAVLPAYATEQLVSLQNVQMMRSRETNEIVINSLHGLIFFPSFHTIAAIIYCYVFRQSGFLRFVIYPLNVAMLLSTPVFGNHYIFDMLAGAAIALSAIKLISMITSKNPSRIGLLRT